MINLNEKSYSTTPKLSKTPLLLDFSSWASAMQNRIEHVLENHLPASNVNPKLLHEAMRYAVLGGGKRVRPLLCYATATFCCGDISQADLPAAAVELIHAYSLVHDDMPCMDNDDLRRGKPSCHKQYNDATALLVGDALQTLAFTLLSQSQIVPNAQQQLQMVSILALASGSRGMAGGQAIDLDSTNSRLSRAELALMHSHKTGALIRAAALLGAYSATKIDPGKIKAITLYADALGLAFQVVDDILDVEADTATLGKTAGKDAHSNKSTYVTILGLVEAKKLAETLYDSALLALNAYSEEANRLRELAHFVVARHF